MSVRYCTNSTITEAWALVLGLPATFDETDGCVVLRAAKRQLERAQRRPAIVAMQATDPTPPFWREQIVWDDERHLARFGHRYLSIHFVRKGEDRYETFETSLRPEVEAWLALYRDALSVTEDTHPVDRVGFGYVNTFEFESNNFDLSRYFKLNFGIGVGANAGLSALETSCAFFDPAQNMHLTVNLAAESYSGAGSDIRVVTKVYAEERGVEGASFAGHDRVLSLLVKAKQAAKDTFFGFATDETHALMGAVDDATGQS